MIHSIGVGLAGFGTVGAGVFKYLQQQRELLEERAGVIFDVRAIAVRDSKKEREEALPDSLVVHSWRDLLNDPNIQIIVELMGGTTDAFELIQGALESGRMVVTGNKALLAERGEEIFALAQKYRVPIFYEAAVAGGIPIIQSLRDAFVSNHIESIHGILNGTTNYILSRMQDAGLEYKEALAEATALGYAEADPTLDLSGWDAGHKALILAALAYGFWVRPEEVRVEGIQEVTAADIQFAKNFGYTIKLLATIRASSDGLIEVGVSPTLISVKSILASVSGVFNAIAIKGDLVGESLFYGRGAGRQPTASSVIGDLVAAAQNFYTAPNKERSTHSVGFASHGLYGKSRPSEEIISSYYLRLTVEDRPGVLAMITTIFGEHGISISSLVQPESIVDVETPLVFMIHKAPYGLMKIALQKITALPCVKAKPVLLNAEPL
ncbi:MAG: homoserine dehydrogenase [Chthoniobacterales bacterium]